MKSCFISFLHDFFLTTILKSTIAKRGEKNHEKAKFNSFHLFNFFLLFVFKFGNTELLEINSGNCSSFHVVKNENVIIHPFSEREIIGKTIPATAGDLFSLSNPDNMDISVTITDDNANQATIHFNAAVSYNEYND